VRTLEICLRAKASGLPADMKVANKSGILVKHKYHSNNVVITIIMTFEL